MRVDQGARRGAVPAVQKVVQEEHEGREQDKHGDVTRHPTGLSVAFPEEYEIQIRPISGLAAKNNITVLNTPGTIDSDYRGELKIILFNHGNENFLINNNDRVAQMILTPIIKMELQETDELPDTVRGEGGFGSTGK